MNLSPYSNRNHWMDFCWSQFQYTWRGAMVQMSLDFYMYLPEADANDVDAMMFMGGEI